mgnify:CR=1 FL=1
MPNAALRAMLTPVKAKARSGAVQAILLILLFALGGCRNPTGGDATVVSYKPYESPGPVEPADEYYRYQWHYRAIEMPGAWGIIRDPALASYFDPADAPIIAVVDTGIHHDHPDLDSDDIGGFDTVIFDADSGSGGYDFFSSSEAYPGLEGVEGPLDGEAGHGGPGRDSDPTDTGDQFSGAVNSWHGVHVSGNIAADTQDSSERGSGVAGIGWNRLQVLPVRSLGKAGASTADVTAALYYAAGIATSADGPVPAEGGAVINLSLGGSIPDDAVLYEAIQAAVDRGATVVAAAGNAGALDNVEGRPVLEPASYDNTIAVSATNSNDEVAWYSSIGPTVDFAAPGGGGTTSPIADGETRISGVLSTGYSQDLGDYAYLVISGTSMATPHVSGVVGLLYAYAPNLTQDAVYAVLAATARDLGTPGYDDEYGHGLINAQAALEYLINASRRYPVRPLEAGGTGGGAGARAGARAGSAGGTGAPATGLSEAALRHLQAQGAGLTRGRKPNRLSGGIMPGPESAYEEDSVIVKLSRRASGSDGQAVARTLASGLTPGDADHSGDVRALGGRLYHITLSAGTGVREAIDILATHEEVEFAQPNFRYRIIE